MNNYDLVLFDFDGTICSTRSAISHCVKRTFEFYSKPVPNDKAIHQTVSQGITMQETFLRLSSNSKNSGAINLEEWVTTYRSIYLREGLEKTQIYSNAKEIFSHLFNLEIPIVVISNKGEAAIQAALKHFDLIQYVFLIIGDRPNIEKKPNPMIFNEIVAPHFNHIKRECILTIGDTATDIQFAKNIGSDSCWVRFGYGNIEECVPLKPTFSISDLTELKDIL